MGAPLTRVHNSAPLPSFPALQCLVDEDVTIRVRSLELITGMVTRRNLPDIVLADLGPAHPLLVFVEVVHSDGPVNEHRKAALLALAMSAGFPAEHVAFVTAFLDRSAGPFRKTADTLAWGSHAWFASEPDHLVTFFDAPGRAADWIRLVR